MLGFMDYVQNAFYEASHWNRDNSYGSLEDTARSNNFLPFAFALAPPFLLYFIFFNLLIPSSCPKKDPQTNT